MSVEIKIPSLGESVSEATIAKWHKKVGDSVNVDELILELETEKVTLEVNASTTGVIESLSKKEGDVVLVGEMVGAIKEGPILVDVHKDMEAPKTTIKTSEMLPPSAKKIVLENNLDASVIKGTGKDGRITKIDALAAVTAIEMNNAPDVRSSQMITKEIVKISDQRIERVKMSRLRKTIAQRLKDSQNTAAILSTFNEIDMSNVIEIRKKYKDIFEKKHGIKLGFMSFFVKAVVAALKEIPSVNAEIDGDDIIYKNFYDLGVAVGTEQGLVVPVLRNADVKSLSQIEKDIADYGKMAKDGKLSPQDLSGGTFTISNGGVYGSLLSTPIINPPQSAILGMHKIQERVIVIDGKMEIKPMMYVALSYDHRIIDGKEAVSFLVKVKDYVESPERLILEI
jgi:2-oxoglutarate dehydrogenase E2 component (dihydrolipoamide succinyltransferase)